MRLRLLVPLVLLAAPALADEGMWTYNNFPSDKVQAKYGFKPTQQWLDKVRLSSARLAGGCSASFVSPDGLVLTNHHCARGCIEELSTAKKNYLRDGFYAATVKQELKCPAVEVNKLLEIRDVTQQVTDATKGKEGQAFNDAQKAVFARLEKECATSPDMRCDVVTLYKGGRYDLYKYQRFQDVRLVFAPETAIAFFGGDPDNFEYPRYDLDMSFLRIYQDGKPAKVDHYFKWSSGGVKAGDLTFISGHPGRTSRLDTLSQLEYAREYALPERLFWLAELRGVVDEFMRRGPEQERIATGLKFGIDNGFKALKGRREALADEAFWNQLAQKERELRQKVDANPEWKKQYGGAWDAIAKAMEAQRGLRDELRLLEGAGGGSDLFRYARHLVRSAAEQQKPNEKRLPEYAEARLPYLKQQLFSTAPVYPQLEELLLSFWLTKAREDLGPDHPVVKQMLGKDSPQQVARRLVRGSKLSNPKVRQQLFEGGQKAVAASKDPMVAFVSAMDDASRAIRKKYEDQVESVVKKNSELIARARFAAYGTNTYPDATFTLRLSYGSVKGYTEEDGTKVEPLTQMAGTYERATGQDPFKLPNSWLRAQKAIEGSTPMNFVSDNDIIGGNSGSPVVNKDAEIVGLVFDGNMQSLGGEYGFDASSNRAVSVHSEAMEEALRNIYKTTRILDELGLTTASQTRN